MAGLLDTLNSDEGRFALGLLAAAGPQAAPMSFGQRLQGVMGQQDAMQRQRKQDQAAEQERALKALLIQSQIGERDAQAQQRAAAQAQAQQQAERMQQFQGALGQAGRVSSADALAGNGGPTMAAAQAVGQPQAIDWQALALKFPEHVKLIEQLAQSGDFGRAEVARAVDVAGAGGRPATQQFDKFGRPVGAALPKAVEMRLENMGGTMQAIDPYGLQAGQSFKRTNTPDALLSAQTAMRGQNMADARSREKNQIDAGAVGKVEWKQDVNGNWIALPKEVSGNQPVVPITTTAPGKREQQATNALAIIDAAGPLIDKATSSYAGAAIDQAGRVFGAASPGAQAGAQLKALEGALMMAQPRMEGPQSDKDVALYRQMAAQIGDPTVPAANKKAALATVRQLHQRYATPGGAASGGASGGWSSAPSVDDLLKKYGGN